MHFKIVVKRQIFTFEVFNVLNKAVISRPEVHSDKAVRAGSEAKSALCDSSVHTPHPPYSLPEWESTRLEQLVHSHSLEAYL
uniref:Uncharacterized protein n=1 Tax=Anguilla anguilla TaxID=7936 RepID=A0A0E9UBW0_ANGAN